MASSSKRNSAAKSKSVSTGAKVKAKSPRLYYMVYTTDELVTKEEALRQAKGESKYGNLPVIMKAESVVKSKAQLKDLNLPVIEV